MTVVAVFAQGALQVGRIAGVPVRVHWTAPLGALVFSGFRFEPVGWACFAGLVLVHELGHALVVKRVGARATAVELTGFGGLCHWSGDVSKVGRAAIAWGGVWAQLLVLGLALLHEALGPPVSSELGARVLWTLTFSNAWMIAFNLVPIRPLDGAEAWALPLLLGRLARRRLSGLADETATPVVQKAAALDTDFDAGARSEEVKALVTTLLQDAKKGEGP